MVQLGNGAFYSHPSILLLIFSICFNTVRAKLPLLQGIRQTYSFTPTRSVEYLPHDIFCEVGGNQQTQSCTESSSTQTVNNLMLKPETLEHFIYTPLTFPCCTYIASVYLPPIT